jgi:transcriptional regulator with XRE-family HTH domain
MTVSQKDIADYLGIDRSTVTKVLNRDPRYSASEKTRELIFRTAERLGYDFTAIRRPFKREYGRIGIDAKVKIELISEDGSLFDEGDALVRNLSIGGALLTALRTGMMMLPLKPFSIRLNLVELPELADLEGECELVRISDRGESGDFQLGVKFVNAKLKDRRRIREFVDQKTREERERTGKVADPESYLADNRKQRDNSTDASAALEP